MASSSNSKLPETAGQPPATTPSSAPRDCESCRSAPGIPFCRVEWSFLCTGCASVVHGHNCIVSVAPNPSANFPHFPYFPYPYPNPNPNPNPNPRSDRNAVVHLSSEEEEISPAWRQISGRATSYRRMESVMRYREKKKSRKFEKTVRYENRRAYAELRPRLEGKFASGKGGEGKEVMMGLADAAGEEGRSVEYVEGDGVEMGQHDFVEDGRFQ